jgi:hypothetical protein
MRTRPIVASNRSLLPVSSRTVSYTMASNVPDVMAKYTPSRRAATMYEGTPVLSPPMRTLSSAPALPMTSTPRRLQRSARMPEGSSRTGTTAA